MLSHSPSAGHMSTIKMLLVCAPIIGLLPGLLTLSGLLAILPSPCRADGAILTMPPFTIQEFYQQAFVRHDAAAGTESLTIMPSFTGDARDFGWVVALPGEPEVTAKDPELFRECASLTAPLVRYRDRHLGCEDGTVFHPASDEGIQVHDDRIVGVYRILILSADDATILTDSLTTWGYLHEGNRAAVEAALQHYVDLAWWYVAVKPDTTQLAGSGGEQGLFRGSLHPLCFTFASEEIIYPLRISALSASPTSEIRIYAVSDRRLTFAGATTLYANHVTAGELQAIRLEHPLVGALLREGDVLTALHLTCTPQQMSRDLVLGAAASQEEYRPVTYAGWPAAEILLLGIVVAMVVRARRRAW
jgi:hypothetical protein